MEESALIAVPAVLVLAVGTAAAKTLVAQLFQLPGRRRIYLLHFGTAALAGALILGAGLPFLTAVGLALCTELTLSVFGLYRGEPQKKVLRCFLTGNVVALLLVGLLVLLARCAG